MSDEILKKIETPTDDRGCFRCQCPHCDEYLKLHVGEYLDRDLGRLNCPMCGLGGETADISLTDDVREVAEVELENLAREMMNDFADEMEKTLRGSEFIEFEAGPVEVDVERVLVLEDGWASGATAVSAAGAILRYGAASVAIVPAARIVSHDFWPAAHPYREAMDRTPYDPSHWPR